MNKVPTRPFTLEDIDNPDVRNHSGSKVTITPNTPRSLLVYDHNSATHYTTHMDGRHCAADNCGFNLIVLLRPERRIK